MLLDAEDGVVVLYVQIKVEGKWHPIAKRYSGEHWINLEPGYSVSGTEPGTDYNTIVIEYHPDKAGSQ
jgi:hypothetical protein